MIIANADCMLYTELVVVVVVVVVMLVLNAGPKDLVVQLTIHPIMLNKLS